MVEVDDEKVGLAGGAQCRRIHEGERSKEGLLSEGLGGPLTLHGLERRRGVLRWVTWGRCWRISF